MGGFMTYNYLTENLTHVSQIWALIAGLAIAAAGIWIAKIVPEENRGQALKYAATALLYFVLVIIIMNSVKTVWAGCGSGR